MFNERIAELKELISRCIYTNRLGAIEGKDALDMVHFLIDNLPKVDGIAYFIGNGGSSAIASHFATDFLRTLEIGGCALSDAALLTCFSNDFGYENVYKIPLSRNLRPQDLLIAISSSGCSQNIIEAVHFAKTKRVPILTFSGFERENPLAKMGDVNFWIDSHDYGLVETAHFFLLHTIVDTFKTCKRRSNSFVTSEH